MFRNIPQVTRNLLLINIVAYVATLVYSGLTHALGLHFFMASDFHVYQLVTYMFMHGGFYHILMNMFMLWMFGSVVERVWGPKKFLLFYFVCGLGAAFCQEVAQYGTYLTEGLANYSSVSYGGGSLSMDAYLNQWNTVGASGAIYGVLLAFGMLFPNERMFIFPLPIPIKAKWIIIGSVVIEFLSALSTNNDGVAHLAHLGGMLFGYLLIRYWRRNTYGGGGPFGWSQGHQFFDHMRANWEARRGPRQQKWEETRTESDWDYNARKQREQEEIDRILDKIRKSGYDSLTKEEKIKLFEQSKR